MPFSPCAGTAHPPPFFFFFFPAAVALLPCALLRSLLNVLFALRSHKMPEKFSFSGILIALRARAPSRVKVCLSAFNKMEVSHLATSILEHFYTKCQMVFRGGTLTLHASFLHLFPQLAAPPQAAAASGGGARACGS